MARLHRYEPMIKRFCQFMGGQSMLARAIDRIAGWILMPPARPAFAGATHNRPYAPTKDFRPETVLMATGPGVVGDYRFVPTEPHEKHDEVGDSPSWWDRPGLWNRILRGSAGHERDKNRYDATHHKDACQEPQYHGMHGRPCKYEGGSDTKCPKGTVSGWFWYYDMPIAGRVYYVDCCGSGQPKNVVWCNWTSEPNWCLGRGRAAAAGTTEYFCTLAIPDVEMKTKDLGGGKFEVAGVDP